MWNDWHEEVRKAAAQTLGKTGHGRAVHDDLRDRILEGDERIRLEAISKVGHLGRCPACSRNGQEPMKNTKIK